MTKVNRRELASRSHLMPDHMPHDDIDTAEVFGVAGGGIDQAQEAIHLARAYAERPQLRGAAVLGRGYFGSMVGRDKRQFGNTSEAKRRGSTAGAGTALR